MLKIRKEIIYCLVLVSLVGAPEHARASGDEDREEATNFVGYQFSVDGDQIRDDLLVPMRFGGVGLSANLGWTFENELIRLHADAEVGFSYVVERMGNPGAILTMGLLLEGYGREIHRLKCRVLDLGLFWRSRITNAMLFSWDDAHLYYLASHVIGPAAALSWPVAAGISFGVNIRVPVLGFAGRPPEQRFSKQEYTNGHQLFVAPHEDTKFVSLASYRSINLEAGFGWKARRSRLRLAYEFDYEHYEDPASFRRLVHRLVFNQDFSLGGRP